MTPTTLLATLLVLCATPALADGKDLMKDPFADEQAKVKKVIDDIVDAVKKKDLDRLDTFHAYTPKFTKFEDDMMGRQDAAASRKGERDGLAALKSFAARIDDLKVDVFGAVAVATFLMRYDADTGKEKMSGADRSTIVFVKDHGAWKIVHEHHSPYKTGP
jgi:ketosteroid isomerase-like protein